MTTQSITLPQAFLDSIKPMLSQDGLDAFLACYQRAPARAIRYSARREMPAQIDVLKPVPWAKRAFYLETSSQPGAHPLHWAGAYYVQEPSAMAAVSVLNPKPGEKVLDLCAAPGGKATQISDQMQGKGLLLANELHPSRASILNRNMERMGITNAVVTNNRPDELAERLPAYFDKVLVDAPCSGEGMFRKDPGALSAWNEDLPSLCSMRQLQIIQDAATMVKPGGKLVYSTCTFNCLENEELAAQFLKANPSFSLQPIRIPGLDEAPSGMLRLWPHLVDGEGHFIAQFIKTDGDSVIKKSSMPKKAGDRIYQELLRVINNSVEEWLADTVYANHVLGNTAVLAPEDCPDLTGLRVLRLGLHMGSVTGKTAKPDHALALAHKPRQALPVSLDEAQAYRRGEVLGIPENISGFLLPTLDGWPLGWGKASQGMLKNHYPIGLRKLGEDRESELYDV